MFKIHILLIICLLLAGCADSQTSLSEQDLNFQGKSSTRALLEMEENNQNFSINQFLQGKWKGKCENPEVDSNLTILEFKEDLIVDYRYSKPGEPDYNTIWSNRRTYEVMDEKTLKLKIGTYELNSDPDRAILKLDKLDEDTLRIDKFLKFKPGCVLKREK